MPHTIAARGAAALWCAAAALAACHPAPPSDAPAPDTVNPDTMVHSVGASATGRVISARDVRDVKVTRVEQLMEGRFAGVEVTRVPGGGVSVRIRGGTSILGDNEPLYVIDGMPVQAGPGGALNGINPEDIARIEVLKDVGSTAMYGVRGANGVVLITTKGR